MNEQEMQFADPDWKPTGQLSAPQENTATGTPLAGPVHSQPRNPNQGNDESFTPYEQGYQGSWQAPPAYASSAMQQRLYPSTSVPRRRSRWWLWAIIAIIIISMFSSISHTFDRGGHDFGPPFSNQVPAQEQQFYGLNGASHVSINDPSGSINVLVGSRGGVAVRASDGSQPAISYQGQNMVITSQGSGDITVTIPQNVALSLKTGANDIEVAGFSGQLAAQTDSGNITLNGDNLNGQSTINANSGNINLEQGSVSDSSITSTAGSITLDQEALSGQVTVSTGGNGTISYNGSLDPQGKYQFITDSGSIDLTLPVDTSMQIQVTQKSGAYHSDFPNSTGIAPQAAVTITTNSGDVGIHNQ